MTVDPASAAGSVEHEGETYYFCSRHCVEKFRNDPEAFLSAAQTSDGGPPQIENAGAPHIAHGMFGEFTVG